MKNVFQLLIPILYLSLIYTQSVEIKDDGDNTLIQITNEGTTGAIMLPSGNAPTFKTNKLYNYYGELNWNGKPASAMTHNGSDIYFKGGNVGIGCSTPASKLSVGPESSGFGRSDATIYGLNYNSVSGFAGFFEGRGCFTEDVGIGTDAPQATLHINDLVMIEPSTIPTSPQEGIIYYDEAAHKLRVFDGTIWADLH